ncbi:exostosin domain-containing protein [Sulfitobacter sabulilitoris]
MPPIVYIVTPCMNAVDTIDRTILSVVTQAGDFRIRYHVQDGGSTDGTFERLLWWQKRLAHPDFPVQCRGLDFTCVAEPDTGMYDAIVTGFETLDADADAFMTWINADDVLMYGALSTIARLEAQFTPEQLSWVGGSAAIIKNDHLVHSLDRQIPTAVIREGLCEGLHWTFVQQEGTFFRKWLWDAVTPARTIRPMRLAGDWNLWRLFAAKCAFNQLETPLGGARFVQNPDMAEARSKAYLAEVDSHIARPERTQAMIGLDTTQPVTHRQVSAHQDNVFSITDKGAQDAFARHYQSVVGRPAATEGRKIPDRLIARGSARQSGRDLDTPTGGDPVLRQGNLIAYDHGWQYPAITEKHAFLTLKAAGDIPSGVTYVAYPWATLIDKVQSGTKDAGEHLTRFRAFCAVLPKTTRKVTVCQHIRMRDYLYLFEEAGIDNIFWTHATLQDRDAPAGGRQTVRPFPLYPVQMSQEFTDPDGHRRPHLFSFIGAKSNQWYMTDVRAWILDMLADDERGLIIGRDTWHYNKVVYDLQIRSNAGSADNDPSSLINQSASDEFRESLYQSVFSLCPSGSGPNSIRLWESLGAGAIPVIMADTYAPPGDPRLWEQAAVFCAETPEAVKALPDRLAEIAADPARLAAMRHAMRQLWLLYGPHSFVTDVQMLMLELGSTPGAASPIVRAQNSDLLNELYETAANSTEMPQRQAQLLLKSCATALLLAPAKIDVLAQSDSLEARGVAKARAAVGQGHELCLHFDRVLDHARRRRRTVKAPAVAHGAVPAVAFFGKHGNRTPLSYDPFQRVLGDQLLLVDDLSAADVLLTGFNIDLRDKIDTLRPVLEARPDTKIAVISEEPLWDTTWSGGFEDRARTMTASGAELSYRFINHQNSTLFDFDRIPYFLLTNDSFIVRYRNLLAAQSDVSPADLLTRWASAPVRAAFFAEVRKGETYSRNFPEHDIYGLGTYRTEVAEATKGDGVMRVGKGWTAGKATAPRRQALPDWHLDKLATLTGQCRVMSSFENTHQHAYVSEKIFDAFAVGAVPTYYASPRHRVFDLVPQETMINTFGLDAAAAARRIAEFEPDLDFAKAYCAARDNLCRRFSSGGDIIAERRRIVREVVKDITALA